MPDNTGSKAIAVEYSLTRVGKTIITPLRGMCRWAKRYRRDVSAEVYIPEGRQGRRASATSENV